jgi:polyferredoxin
MASALAEAILVIHFGIAAFIVLGFVLIPLGAMLGWQWIRSRRLRTIHLVAISFVAAESVAGIACPLTVWEDLLRGTAPGDGSFIERWVGGLLYYDLPAWVFLGTYVALAMLGGLLWFCIPPRRAVGRAGSGGANA